jgi:hypothetical protein
MYLTLKYDLPLSDYYYIPSGTQLDIDTTWRDYEGFVAAKYRNGMIYFNALYLSEFPTLVEVFSNSI